MAAIQIEIPPVAEPVTLIQAKSHLRVTIPDDDALICAYIQAAREGVEAFLARSLVNKGYRQSLDSFPYFTDTMMSQMAYPPSYYSLPRYSTTLWNYSQMIKLFYSPLQQVSRISYHASDGGGWQHLYPAQENWQALTIYDLGDQIEDSNGNLQTVTAITQESESGPAQSGATQPTWATEPDATTPDGGLVWTNGGPAPPGTFVVDRDSEPPRIFPLPGQYWPSVLYVPNAVRIHYTSGYGPDGTNVPGLAKVGILQTVGGWYENRESVSPADLKEVPGNVQDLLWGLRVLDYAPTRG
jgi:hypothetical protein